MKKILILPVLVGIVLLISCRSNGFDYCKNRKKYVEVTNEFSNLPGQVKIDSNLYIDYEEISNISYREFLSWNQYYYPEKYSSVMPDTISWQEEDTLSSPFMTYYLWHPVYREYPVVGVSYEQALLFSKWRSDRVMEYILEKENVLKPRDLRYKDPPFTIEDYFNGKYMNLIPNPKFKWYPEFSLPDTIVFKEALKFAEMFNAKYAFKTTKKSYCKILYNTINCAEFKHKVDQSDKLIQCRSNCARIFFVMHLRGNARELTNIKGFAFGGSYKDSCYVVEKAPIQRYDSTDVHTGFRNMCRWKRWPGL